MTKPELKEFIKKCFVEMLTEDFIQKSVNQIIKERIVINIPTPSFNIERQPLEESTERHTKQQLNYQSKLSVDARKKLHEKIVADDGDIIDPSKVNGFTNPQLRALAQDTVEHQAEKAEEIKDVGFTKEELSVFDVNKSLKILDAADKKS
jgi:hypothetical protein